LIFDVNLFTLGTHSFNYDSFANTNYGILSIDDPITFNNTSTGDILTYLWSFGDGNTSTDKDPIHTYVAEGTYEVTLTVQGPYGCSYVDTMTVNIGKGYDIVIPNAFTPNNDGLNDVIRPVYIGMIDVEMSIYSTWEGLIYFEKGLELNGWNGTIKNSLAENGNYIIKVKATTFYGLVLSFNRPITLIK
jgi:gliding motility-associated-like protein